MRFILFIARVVLWIIFVLAIGYFALVIYRIPAVREKNISQQTVAKIDSQKLTMADVEGINLPPPPDPNAANATLAGIDANGNGIRDDVELAIFAEYPTSSPTSTAIREAESQYAMELQMEFTAVIDSPTLEAVIRQESRGFLCIANDRYAEQVEASEFNTDQRREFRDEIYKKYMTSFKLSQSDFCDVSTI